MKSVLDKVEQFHRKFGAPVGTGMTHDRLMLRYNLIQEELNELWDAMYVEYPVDLDATDGLGDPTFDPDPVSVADALGDLIYVVAGAAVEWGIPLDKVVNEIHRSNMTKEGGGCRADGKILKGPNYEAPNLEPILFPEMEKAPPVKEEPEERRTYYLNNIGWGVCTLDY